MGGKRLRDETHLQTSPLVPLYILCLSEPLRRGCSISSASQSLSELLRYAASRWETLKQGDGPPSQ